jgi:hypothetical protein
VARPAAPHLKQQGQHVQPQGGVVGAAGFVHHHEGAPGWHGCQDAQQLDDVVGHDVCAVVEVAGDDIAGGLGRGRQRGVWRAWHDAPRAAGVGGVGQRLGEQTLQRAQRRRRLRRQVCGVVHALRRQLHECALQDAARAGVLPPPRSRPAAAAGCQQRCTVQMHYVCQLGVPEPRCIRCRGSSLRGHCWLQHWGGGGDRPCGRALGAIARWPVSPCCQGCGLLAMHR